MGNYTFQSYLTAIARVINACVFALAVSSIACVSEEDESSRAHDPDSVREEGDGGAAVPAYFVFNRVPSPAGRTMYASVLPSLEAGELDLAEALELSGLSRARVFDGKLFAFDGETGQVTRYAIGPAGQISPDVLEDGQPARMSFAHLGVTLFSNNIYFESKTRAFQFATLTADLVIEWNPTAMTISRSFDAGLLQEGFTLSGGRIAKAGRHVMMPVSWLHYGSGEAVMAAAVAVLDLDDTTELVLLKDDRCVGTSAVFESDGEAYALSDNMGGLLDQATEPDALPPPCLLKVVPEKGRFDEEYYVDLAAVTGHPLVSGAVSAGDGSLLTLVYDSDEDFRELNPFLLLDGDYWTRALVDLKTLSSEAVGSLAPGPIANAGWVVDGHYHVPHTFTDEGEATLNRISGTTSDELLNVSGEIFFVDRVR